MFKKGLKSRRARDRVGPQRSKSGRAKSEMTMGQRVTGYGSSGSTNLSGSPRSRVSTRDPLTHDFVC